MTKKNYTEASKLSGPPVLDKEAMIEADKRATAWAESPEGKKFLKEHLPPEVYKEQFPDD